MRAQGQMDMLHGGLAKNIFLFSLPLLFSGLLQCLYHAADMIIVGRFVGDSALAAVGATVSLYGVIVNLFMGLSVGVDVRCSFHFGMGDEASVRKIIDTAILSSLLVGGLVAALGWWLTAPLLSWMNTPVENGVFDGAVLYMRICFLGMPFTMLYNFAAAVLRTRGETRLPFVYLAVAGLLNVGLNILFVTAFGMEVEGVAIATVASQALSAILIMIDLWRRTGLFSFRLRGARFAFLHFRRILLVGLLAGVQNAIFSVSNSFLQSGINSLGEGAIAGCAACETVEEFLWVAVAAFQYAAVTFVSQNAGARQYDRVKRILFTSLLMSVATGIIVGLGSYFAREPILSLFIKEGSESGALAYALERADLVFPLYALAAVMATVPSAIRGLGYNTLPVAVNVMCICVFRVIWRFTVFPAVGTVASLFLVYPISWVLADIALTVAFFLCFARRVKRDRMG